MLPGLAVFALFLFLPGASLVELLGVGKGLPFASKLGLAVGLGSAVDVVILVLRTSGLAFSGYVLAGVTQSTVEGVILASTGLILLSVGIKRRSEFVSAIDRADLLVLLMTCGLGLLVYAYFRAYPVFPQYPVIDFASHAQYAAGLQSGASVLGLSNFFYYGADLLSAAALATTGGVPLDVAQRAMGVLLVLSPPLVYASLRAVFRTASVGLVGTFLYVATGFAWFAGVFGSGLYDNFLGEVVAMTILVCLGSVVGQPGRKGVWAAAVIALWGALYSHYSILTFALPVLLLPLFYFTNARIVRKDLVALSTGSTLVPATLVVLLRPDVAQSVAGLVSPGSASAPLLATPLSQSLSFLPVLGDVAAEIFNDPATAALLLFALLGGLVAVKRREPLPLVIAAWFLAIAAASEFAGQVWRFSYEALLPLLFLGAYGTVEVFQALRGRLTPSGPPSGRGLVGRRAAPFMVLAVLLLLLVQSSWASWMVADAAGGSSQNSADASSVYQSILWFGTHSPPGSELVSPTDSRFEWASLLVGKESSYAPFAPLNYTASSSTGGSYVAVTRTLYPSLPGVVDVRGFLSDSRLKLVYQNQDVWLFVVNASR